MKKTIGSVSTIREDGLKVTKNFSIEVSEYKLGMTIIGMVARMVLERAILQRDIRDGNASIGGDARAGFGQGQRRR